VLKLVNKNKRNESKPISYRTVKMNTTLDGYIINEQQEIKEGIKDEIKEEIS